MSGPSYPGVTITRGPGNIPIIDAPDILTGIEASAYMGMYDRPQQIYGMILGANGMLNQLLPSVGYLSDIESLAYLYTDEDVLRQYEMLTPNTKMLIEHTVIGTNKRIEEIPLPFQPVTKVMIFNLVYIAANSFTPKIFFQSGNSSIYEALQAMYSDPGTADAILNDIVGVNGETKATNPVVSTVGGSGGSISNNDCIACTIPIEEYYDDLEKQRKEAGTHITMGSRSIVTRDDDRSILMGGAQAGQGVPSPVYITILNTPDYKTDALAIPGTGLGILVPNIINKGYAYTVATQTGSFHARDGTLVPEGETYVYRTVTLNTGGGTIEYEVRRSSKGGFVLPVTTDVPPGQVVVARTAFADNAMVGVSVMIEMLFLEGIDDLASIPDRNYHTDVPLMVMTYADSEDNIGAIHTGMTTTIDKPINRKLLSNGNWEYTSVHKPVVSINENSLYRYWNGAWSTIQDTYHKNYYEYSKEHWIDHTINAQDGDVSYENARDILATLGNSVVLGLNRDDLPDLVNDTDAFTIIGESLRPMMEGNPDAQAFIDRYDGTWISGDTVDEVVTNDVVSEDWVIANTWLANIIKGIFQGIVPDSVIEDSDKLLGVGTTLLSLLIRLISNPMNNKVYYQGYPTQDEIATIVSDAWDEIPDIIPSLDRPTYEFLTGSGITIPYHQHGTHESASEISSIGYTRRGHIIAPSNLATGVDLLDDFQHFRLIQLGPRLLAPSNDGTPGRAEVAYDMVTAGTMSMPPIGSQYLVSGTVSHIREEGMLVAYIPATSGTKVIRLLGKVGTYGYDITYVYDGDSDIQAIRYNVSPGLGVEANVVDGYIWVTTNISGIHDTIVTTI